MLLFGWVGITSEAGIVMFYLLFGFASAGFITLPAAVIAADSCPDLRQFGVRFTMQSVPSGIGLLIGNPIAGAVLDKGWLNLRLFGINRCHLCLVGCRRPRLEGRMAFEYKILMEKSPITMQIE